MTDEQMIALIDLRTRQSKELFTKHFSKVPDELALIVLKGHLLVEQSLTGIISHYTQPSADLANVNFRFAQKVALAKALVPTFFFPLEFWEFVNLLNQMRNDLAHQLESKKREQHLGSLRTIFTAHQKFFVVPSYPTDEWKLKSLIGLWLGVLDPIDALIHAMEHAKVYNLDLRRLAELAREQCQKWPDTEKG
jgi:hypothetical protein